TVVSLPVSTNVLRIGVKAVNGVGVSTTSNTALANPTTTSTGKLLTLTAVRPAAPTLKMFDMAVSSTVAVTDISKYIGTNTPLTLVGTVAATTLASSFSWELAEGVNVVAGSVLSSNSIRVNFEDVASGTASLYVGIKAVNCMGSSVISNIAALPATGSTATLLKLTAGLPSAAGIVVGSLAICSNQASSVTYTITMAAAKTNLYNITAPVGTTIVGGVMNTRTINAVAGASFTVNYPNGFTSVIPTQKKISIQSVNGFGVSVTNKVLTLTSNACTTTARIAKAPQVATDFKVIAYPNPSSGVFNLAIESSNTAATTIQVYDMQGRMIENKKTNTNAVEIGANYTSGIYNVILENAGQAKTIRLIKK
ncbi:MAG: T9SS type A sorting domain-containing protein, partial [Burkholderiales bacterium]|nr:T9SS type A sorting domain-containing protein [Flavobacterium sp.]